MRSRERWNRFHITFSFKRIHTGGKWSRSVLANLKQCKHTYMYRFSVTLQMVCVMDRHDWQLAHSSRMRPCRRLVLQLRAEIDLLWRSFKKKKKDLMNCTKKGHVCVHFPEKVDSSTLNSFRVRVNSSTGIDSLLLCPKRLLVCSFSNLYIEHDSWVHYISKKLTKWSKEF